MRRGASCGVPWPLVTETHITLFHEDHPTWDADKRRVIGSAPDGTFELSYQDGDALPHDWWVACTQTGNVVGYGWLRPTWGGDADIMLAVLAGAHRQGTGTLILARLETEAADHRHPQVCITVPDTHPHRDELQDWLAVRGYRWSTTDRALRKQVGGMRVPRQAQAGGALRVAAHD